MNLGLGTAQFGLDYGIANSRGNSSLEEVEGILLKAEEFGISTLDTAPLYGTSEEVLGRFLKENHAFKLVTKTPKFSGTKIGGEAIKELEKAFIMSLSKMKQSKVYGLLIHDCDDLSKKDGHRLINTMLDLKNQGLVKKIGISIYNDIQIDYMLDNFPIDLIQIPINVFDQRLLKSGHLLKLKKAGIEIHARSIFLQGLLIMAPESLPPFFNSKMKHIKEYHSFVREKHLTLVGAAISFARGIKEIDVILCGVNNVLQLKEILDCYESTFQYGNWEKFALDDANVLNPSNWRL